VLAALRKILRNQVGFETFAESLMAEIVKLNEGDFLLDTNIDFVRGNELRKRVDPTLEAFTSGNLIVGLLDASADINIAAHYGGDFYTSALNSDLVKIRHAELLRRTDISSDQIQQFQDIVLPEYPTLREVINSKEHSFQDFERLLDQSERFRQSIHQMGPDAKLVAEYFQAVTKEGWISGLPAKSMRYVLGMGLGAATAAHPLIGAAWSAIDTFILDRLSGWRPSHFVDGKLKPFLDSDR
jgi:hypothetical protein